MKMRIFLILLLLAAIGLTVASYKIIPDKTKRPDLTDWSKIPERPELVLPRYVAELQRRIKGPDAPSTPQRTPPQPMRLNDFMTSQGLAFPIVLQQGQLVRIAFHEIKDHTTRKPPIHADLCSYAELKVLEVLDHGYRIQWQNFYPEEVTSLNPVVKAASNFPLRLTIDRHGNVLSVDNDEELKKICDQILDYVSQGKDPELKEAMRGMLDHSVMLASWLERPMIVFEANLENYQPDKPTTYTFNMAVPVMEMEIPIERKSYIKSFDAKLGLLEIQHENNGATSMTLKTLVTPMLQKMKINRTPPDDLSPVKIQRVETSRHLLNLWTGRVVSGEHETILDVDAGGEDAVGKNFDRTEFVIMD